MKSREKRGTCVSRLLAAGLLTYYDAVWHASIEEAPQRLSFQDLGFLCGDTEKEELFHSLMEAGPLITVLVHAGLQKARTGR